jgi:hypothetical protein
LRAVSGFNSTAAFDAAQCGKQLGCGDFGDGPAAEPRKYVTLQPLDDLVGMACRPVRRIFRKPFTRNDFEAVLAAIGGCRLLVLRCSPGSIQRISRKLLADFVASIASVLERAFD